MNKEQLNEYDHIIFMISGGKDSEAMHLYCEEIGLDRSKAEFWHHDVDGREGSTLMDWPITRDYCKKYAEHFEIPIYYSWKEGGFEREMCKNDSLTAPTIFETPGGIFQAGGILGKPGTRQKFPQITASLRERWCSSALKIDVADIALRNQDRFRNKKTLVITGERAEESSNRANYAEFEPHRSDLRNGKKFTRHIDHWRPVHKWTERQIWEIIERHRINPHPAYRLGWGRTSCAACIFGNADQWATLSLVNPGQYQQIVDYEKRWFDLHGITIKRNKSIPELVKCGTPYLSAKNNELVNLATSNNYTDTIIMKNWKLPAGAYGDSCGPS